MKPTLKSLRALLLAASCLVAQPALAQTAPIPAAAAAPATPARQAQPMNMIFVLVDDLRFDAMGFLTPGLQTPNIDYLAKNGAYFPNAVVTSSLCSPSRATILTGQSPRNHRVIDNNHSSEEGLVFFPSYLQQAGYQTGFFGKWHMGNDTDAPRPGFDRWVSFKGQGAYFPTDAIPPAQVAAGQRQMLNVDGAPTQQKGYITDELTDYAMDWLEHGRDSTKPFFLYLSHKAVHSDAKPPERYANQYSDLEITLPASMADTPENNRGKPVWVQNQRNSWHGADFPYHTDRDLREQVRDIYRTLTPIDDSLGRILQYLRANGLEQNTMIVFYSDNGFMFGDHGLIDKRNAYQPSVRVPMVVYAPGHVPAGMVNPAVVRNLDLAPTFLEAAGVGEPSQMEGKSFLPLVEGEVTPQAWQTNDFVYEYYWEWTFPQTPTTFSITRNGVKYIQYHGVWDIEEVYDLSKDPDEMNNVANDPAYVDIKRELRHALHASLATTGGEHVIPYTERTSEGLVHRDVNGARAADFPAEWYVEPNQPGRMNGLFPDTPAKDAANAAGRSYFPSRTPAPASDEK